MKKGSKVQGAFGIVDRAPLEVSETLKALNMSHTYAFRDGFRYCSMDIQTGTPEQPIWPIIVDSVKTLSRTHVEGPYVFLVIDSRAALSATNTWHSLWPENRGESFEDALKSALIYASSQEISWELQVKEPSLMDYVNTATKPSQLNNLQSLVYKVNPYALRKEIQGLCISYLAGNVPWSVLKQKLKSNLKLQPLFDLMSEQKTEDLKTAVARAKYEPLDKVVNETGFQSFELLYIMKSAAQNAETGTKAKAKK